MFQLGIKKAPFLGAWYCYLLVAAVAKMDYFAGFRHYLMIMSILIKP